MSNDTKWIEAVTKINELTQTGQLKWEARKNTQQPIKIVGGLIGHSGTFEPVGTAFVALYKDKVLRISKSRFKKSDDFGLSGGLLDAYYSSNEKYLLEILDSNENELLKVPVEVGLNDLYQSIQYQIADVDGILNSLLS